jgi:hypothetical protein
METLIQSHSLENPFVASDGSVPLVMLLADTEVDVGVCFRSRKLLSDTVIGINPPSDAAGDCSTITSCFTSLSINDFGQSAGNKNSATLPSQQPSALGQTVPVPVQTTAIAASTPVAPIVIPAQVKATPVVLPPQTLAPSSDLPAPSTPQPAGSAPSVTVVNHTVISSPNQNQMVQVSMAGLTRTIPIIPRPIHAGREKQAMLLQALEWDTMLFEAVRVNTLQLVSPR